MFGRILIANRGEIACRVIRTARRLGIETVAVYSAADVGAQHVRLADKAIAIGPAPVRDSYLRGDLIIDAARASGAQAVHPGYGFLAENAGFAADCARAGLVFVGPSPEAMRNMGDKRAAKTLVAAAGIVVTPGYHGDDQSDERLAAEAIRIGFPVVLKAVAGGGGMGMRVVARSDELAERLASARREAQAAFGDTRMLLEKYLSPARHLEVQVFGDSHGAIVHLFERDCSVQRRHQKIVEEAPASHLSPEERQQLGNLAVQVARTVNYQGAGTVEFISGRDKTFHFMEMNTRLQVEHPVTEMITGVDLVEWQLRVAAGEPLPLTQAQITLSGHAIEARLCAENPRRNFLPATGTLQQLNFPAGTPDLRIDTGVVAGDTVTIEYDSLLAKLIVRGANRAEALARLTAALAATSIEGVHTNREFLLALLAQSDIVRGGVDTGLVERELAAIVATLPTPGGSSVPADPWDAVDGWRPNLPPELPTSTGDAGTNRRPTSSGSGAGSAGTGSVLAPMPGRVIALRTKVGATVRRGEVLLVLEAMKMEHAIVAPAEGQIRTLSVAVGDQVDEGAVLLVVS
ncbi:MAG: biotin carboxylase N-terminal domain-containing protein [Gammaproteobacteria bacterium]